MLNLAYWPALPAQYPPTRLPASVLQVRRARRQDWPCLRSFLLSAGLSSTGLYESFDNLLVLERRSPTGVRNEVLGCVAVEQGHPPIIRSLATTPEGLAEGTDSVLLESALQLAAENGASEAIMVVETTAQLPAYHLGMVLWENLRKRCPHSALVRELGSFDSTALAIRLPLPSEALRYRAG